MRGIAVALMFASVPALACQNSCVIVEVESRRGELFVNGSAGEQPLTDASIVVRSAPATKRRSYCGAAKGKVVKKLKTDSRGQFELGALPAGQYWITYIHPEDGESFLVQIGPHVEEKPFRLVVDGYVASICAVPDVERNTTKPPGWEIGRASEVLEHHEGCRGVEAVREHFAENERG